MKFENLGLNPKILKALNESGYTDPTEIQVKAIPEILDDVDIRASAQTGTGKTAAFLLPALNRLAEFKPGKGPRILILAPTRELAMQIKVQADKYGKYLPKIKSVCIGGGVPYHKQLPSLRGPYDLLISTPGRLLDFLGQGKISLNRVEMLILDEADRMLDMGFLEPVEEIVSKTPNERQTLLFSATLPKGVKKLSENLLQDPTDIVIHAEQAKHEHIEQSLHRIDDLHHKNRLLDRLLKDDSINNAIIFTSTKRHADQLVDELYDKGHSAASLHGDMPQRKRTRTIEDLRKGKFKILVATDVAARGIDVQSITHVINFDLPQNAEDYVHRIGRTGRAGAKGTAVSFAGSRDNEMVRKIEKFTGQPFNVVAIPGFEPTERKKKKQVERNRTPFNGKKKTGKKPFAEFPRNRKKKARGKNF